MHAFILLHSQLSRTLAWWLASNSLLTKNPHVLSWEYQLIQHFLEVTAVIASTQLPVSGLNLVMHLAHFPTCATEMLVKMQADRQTMLLVELSWCWSYLSEFFSLSSPRWFTRQLFDESFHNTLKLERWVPELNVPWSALVSNSLLKFLWQWGLDPGPHAYILKHCSPSSITIIY